MTEPKHIQFCLPNNGSIKMDTCLCLLACVLETRKLHGVSVVDKRSSLITLNRNALVSDALKKTADYLMFIDTDMIFPPDTVNRLVSWDKPVVGAVYRMRSGNQPVNGIPVDLSEAISSDRKDLIQMKRMPTGLMMIRRDVVDKIGWPWFAENYQIFGPREGDVHGADFCFSDQVVSAGFDLWADPALSWKCGHIAETVLTMMPPTGAVADHIPLGIVMPPSKAAAE